MCVSMPILPHAETEFTVDLLSVGDLSPLSRV